ncbi:hypothetical protein [Aliiglaciecola sp. LCG003]|uniref:hypothetical protein n=1 Tax=Aliiglaciecola sp. LCG003 TaxID=3053655 RepID=UPI002572D443|nr:hypothetical protein [Aliiglaciecola sp. LCG003]WJG10692.1 hypothetical protein QR722_06525 [Aliiglaciecola sp. LCG003]
MDNLFQSIQSDALREELGKLGDDNLTRLKSWADIKPFAAELDQHQQQNFLKGFTASVLGAVSQSESSNEQLKQAVETVLLDVLKNPNFGASRKGISDSNKYIPDPTPYIFLPPDLPSKVGIDSQPYLNRVFLPPDQAQTHVQDNEYCSCCGQRIVKK